MHTAHNQNDKEEEPPLCCGMAMHFSKSEITI